MRNPILPPPSFPEDKEDVVFEVGEKLEIKGGEFRIKSIGNKFLILESLPGTKWFKV